MIRAHENSIALKAGVLSFLVHGVLLGLLLLSFNWKVVQPASIATVELWSELPTKPVVVPPTPQPKPPEPKPEPKIEVKPDPKPEPEPEPKAEIEVKKEPPKPKVEPKPKPEPKPEPKPDPKIKEREAEKKRQEEALKKLQQAMLEEDMAKQEASPNPQGQSAVQSNKGEIDKYGALLQSIIKPRINNQLCGTGKPVLEYQINLMPTGEILGEPKLLSGSGITACDEAVYRAIKLSSPLPKPPPSILQGSRDMNLKFRPND